MKKHEKFIVNVRRDSIDWYHVVSESSGPGWFYERYCGSIFRKLTGLTKSDVRLGQKKRFLMTVSLKPLAKSKP